MTDKGRERTEQKSEKHFKRDSMNRMRGGVMALLGRDEINVLVSEQSGVLKDKANAACVY